MQSHWCVTFWKSLFLDCSCLVHPIVFHLSFSDCYFKYYLRYIWAWVCDLHSLQSNCFHLFDLGCYNTQGILQIWKQQAFHVLCFKVHLFIKYNNISKMENIDLVQCWWTISSNFAYNGPCDKLSFPSIHFIRKI